MRSNLFFVYGTLKSGFSNNWLLQENPATLIDGGAVTVEQYHLYVAGLPYVVDRSSECFAPAFSGHQIKGELWRADDDVTIEALDRLEGHPRFYERRLIEVCISTGIVEAWLYFHPMSAQFERMKPVSEFKRLVRRANE